MCALLSGFFLKAIDRTSTNQRVSVCLCFMHKNRMTPVLRDYLVPTGPLCVAAACSQAAAVSSALEAQQATVADLRAKLSAVEADAKALQAQVEEATAHRDQLQVPYSLGDVLCASRRVCGACTWSP